jgi:hypothetical protein
MSPPVGVPPCPIPLPHLLLHAVVVSYRRRSLVTLVVSYYVCSVEVHHSARKHGVADEDAVHAAERAIVGIC